MKTLFKVFCLAAILLLTACAGGGTVMDNSDYLSADKAGRSAYLKKIQEEENALVEKRNVEYHLGRPVQFDTGDAKYTKQWDRQAKIVYVYPGHSPGGMGIETQSILALRTDENGDVLYGPDNRPVTILANVATQEEFGRMMVKGGFQIASGAVNGMGASLINRLVSANNDCSNGGCGNPIVNQNLVKSESVSGSNADVKTGINATLGGSCGPSGCGIPTQ